MFAGHYATALVAKQHQPAAPIAYYLVASQLPDLLWNVFHFLGLETTTPDNPMLVSLDSMQAVMTYSHDLLPSFGWLALVVLAGRAITGGWRQAAMGGALFVVHVLTDLAAGHPHNVFGPDSPSVATGMYRWAPYLAVGLEAAFTAAMLLWVRWQDRRTGRARTRGTRVIWALVFGGGLAFMFASADLSMAELTGLEPIAALSGWLVPFLAANYLGMFAALVWAERRDPLVPSA